MIPLDYRWRWDEEVMTDPRVIHLWDEDKLVGQWIAEHIEGYQGVVWDSYYLYGPEARWDITPTPLINSGYTVLRQREELQQSILPLLTD